MPKPQTLGSKNVVGISDSRLPSDGDHMGGSVRPSGPSYMSGDARQDSPGSGDLAPLGRSGFPAADKGFIKHPF